MFFRRAFSVCCFSLLALQTALAQSNPPADADPPSAPTASPSQQLTFSSVHVDGPYVAMTFDDGPSAALTPKLLDLLAAHHMKVTFFVVGQNAADHPDILKRAVREGHEIANHSWSHPNYGKMGDEAVRRDLQKTDDAIKAAIGTRPTLMRPPYGSITARQKSWIHQEFGYRIILWDVDPNDWKRPGPSVVTRRIVNEARPGSIILSHDIHPPTIEAMPATFDQLQAKGFKFVTVSELLAMAKPLPPKPTPSARPATAATEAITSPAPNE
ncbi:MAG: polysaccharide deacetylase family protein [Chthoniobacterales bacterium]